MKQIAVIKKLKTLCDDDEIDRSGINVANELKCDIADTYL
jgi:hypothetical protein